MSIIDKFVTKNDFLSTAENANFISEKALDCLDPVLIAYIYDGLTDAWKNIATELNMLSLYLNQLDTLEKKLKNIKINNPELFKNKRNMKIYMTAIMNINKVYEDISSLKQQISESNRLKGNKDLKKALTSLEQLKNQIKENQQRI